MKKIILLIFMAIVIQGCSTPYKAKGGIFSSDGFSETQLDKNVFRVEFLSNEFTSSSKTADYLLLRGAELTIENGYRYFSVINEDSYTNSSSATIFGSRSSTYYSGRSSDTYTQPPATISKKTSVSKNTIMMFKERPEFMSYDAYFLYNSITKKYGVKVTRHLDATSN